MLGCRKERKKEKTSKEAAWSNSPMSCHSIGVSGGHNTMYCMYRQLYVPTDIIAQVAMVVKQTEGLIHMYFDTIFSVYV